MSSAQHGQKLSARTWTIEILSFAFFQPNSPPRTRVMGKAAAAQNRRHMWAHPVQRAQNGGLGMYLGRVGDGVVPRHEREVIHFEKRRFRNGCGIRNTGWSCVMRDGHRLEGIFVGRVTTHGDDRMKWPLRVWGRLRARRALSNPLRDQVDRLTIQVGPRTPTPPGCKKWHASCPIKG